MKKIAFLFFVGALIACSPRPSGEGGESADSTKASTSVGLPDSGGGSDDGSFGSICDLYKSTPFEVGEGGGTFFLEIPVECQPFYLEKGRPPEDDVKTPDMSVGPEPFLGSEPVDVCIE